MPYDLPLDAAIPGPVPRRSPRTGPGFMWRRTAGACAVVGVAAFVVAGCGSASKTTAPAAAASASPTSTTVPATTTTATAQSPATAADTVTATLTEFNIALSRTHLTPGTYTFRAVNAGHVLHSLEINGPGVVDRALPAGLHPGQSADLTVTLAAGTYDVFCPVPGHKALGMNLELTVGGAAAPAPAAAPATTTTVSSGSGYGY